MTQADDLRSKLRALGGAFANRPAAPVRVLTRTGFRRSKVSAAGQFTLSLEARRQWELTGGDFVEMIGFPRAILIRPALDKDGYLATPIDAVPGGVVFGRALPDGSERVRRYKMSRVGQVSLPAPQRTAWGLRRGGVLEVGFVGSYVVVFPVGTSDDLANQWVGDLEIGGTTREEFGVVPTSEISAS